MFTRNQKGFTLVEIAVVLVIVGLLIGGVLKAQEMITNAKLKRIESDSAGIAAAMFSYRDRYYQLPGDDRNAIQRFQVYNAFSQANGNGNGSIGLGNDWNKNTATAWTNGGEETLKFFAHLRAAGLIPGEGRDDTRPTNAFGGQIGIQHGALLLSGHVLIFGAIEGPIAQVIESRIDDGVPDSGRIQSDLVGQSMNAQDSSGTGSSVSAYSDSQRYNMAFRL